MFKGDVFAGLNPSHKMGANGTISPLGVLPNVIVFCVSALDIFLLKKKT